jgi:hypothetical protein
MTSNSLRELRDDRAVDQTLQNLLRALMLNLELRARYRVFEFEARQDGYADTARLFQDLWRVEGEQIADLITGLRERLGPLERVTPSGSAE